MSEVKTWTIDSECLIHSGLNKPVDMVLKSDYDALAQLSDAFYLKQVQLENQNEDLKAKLEKAVEALKEISKYTSAYSGASSPEANLAKQTLRELGVEFEA